RRRADRSVDLRAVDGALAVPAGAGRARSPGRRMVRLQAGRHQPLNAIRRADMIEAEWWEYDSLEELADAVAGDVGFIVESAVDARGSSLIAVPGGSTGPAVFAKLAAQKLPWKNVTIIPTDDRLVPTEDEGSDVRATAKA